MEDEKRKRTRKRPRRGKKSEDEASGKAPTASVETTAEVTEPIVKAAAPINEAAAAAANGGPTLSFYQRTNPHKPSALPSLSGNSTGRQYTVSVALPGSIILNAQTPELQSRLAGHIARCCAIFNIDEIVVFDEGGGASEEGGAERGLSNGAKRRWDNVGGGGEEEGYGYDDEEGKRAFDPNSFLARILQYVETPQYLRKSLFPMHRDLRLAGLLAPLDCPHHLRYEDQSPYREGVTVEAPHWAAADRRDAALVWVHTGLRDPVGCTLARGSTADVPIGARVTVRMPKGGGGGKDVGQLVSPREPVEQRGLYWGYTVRLCRSLSEAISETSFAAPYDFVIGTSERGASLTDVLATPSGDTGGLPAQFEHALIVFGGLSGLEVAVERDPGINASADDASELFDAWVNVVEGQGSRTIRTEEALLITLARLKVALETTGKPSPV